MMRVENYEKKKSSLIIKALKRTGHEILKSIHLDGKNYSELGNGDCDSLGFAMADAHVH